MQNLNKIKIAPDSICEIGQDKKSWFPKWDVKDDTTLYKKVNKLAHSTFDLSKFTVVGSPNITDDGIASGFSGISDYVTTSSLNLSGKFAIYGQFRLTSYNTGISYSAFLQSIVTGTVPAVFAGVDGAGHIYLTLSNNGSTWNNIGASTSTITVLLNTDLNYKFYFDGSNYKLDINEVNYCTIASTDTIYNINNIAFRFGSASFNINAYLTGSIDLKQFSITVDGKPIFSGNKTGIDTIKADNFTKLGNPNITDDGIASGLSTGNRLEINFDSTGKQNFEIKMPCYLTSTSGISGSFMWSDAGISTYTSGTNYYIPSLLGTAATAFGGTEALQANINYDVILKVENNTSCTFKIVRKDTNVTIAEKTWTTARTTEISTIYVSQLSNLVIDLNAFKIYVDGDLIYQPCLKIPYTEGQNYVKIVDKLYRDRVKDLFEQVGYNGYHTIDEENKNFTLPTHKFTDIIDHKEDADGTVAEQRVDMTVMAYGVAENGTDVNLPIEFADGTSYMVGGVTVSAKDADSFTPSSSGTWFARGKGKI